MLLSEVLTEFDEKVLPSGKVKTFSIGFVKKNGEYVYYSQAKACGLRMNMSKNAMRGVVEINEQGKEISHKTAVSIWLITDFNGKKVYI